MLLLSLSIDDVNSTKTFLLSFTTSRGKIKIKMKKIWTERYAKKNIFIVRFQKEILNSDKSKSSYYKLGNLFLVMDRPLR